MNKNINIAIGLAVVAVILGTGYLKQTEVKVNVNVPEQSTIVGASAGPVRTERFESINGVGTYSDTTKFNQASTTVCGFKTPAATTTALSLVGNLRTGTTTAIMFEWGKSTLPTATTTSLGKFFLGSDAQATMIASTSAGAFSVTGTGIDPAFVFAPNTYVSLKYGGAAGALNVLQGSCTSVLLSS